MANRPRLATGAIIAKLDDIMRRFADVILLPTLIDSSPRFELFPPPREKF